MGINIASPGGNATDLKSALTTALAGTKLNYQLNIWPGIYGGTLGNVGAYILVDNPTPASANPVNPPSTVTSTAAQYAEVDTPADATDWSGQTYLNATYAAAYHFGTATGDQALTWLAGQYNDTENLGGGDINEAIGTYSYIFSNGGKIYTGIGNWSDLDGSGSLLYESAYGYFFTPPGAGTCTDIYSYWSNDLSGVATNAYYFWADSRGVLRIKEDTSFDSVGQAIAVLYNPQFAKYTAGAVDFERGVFGRWNGNVFESGPENGGTGTQRHHNLIGASVGIPTAPPASATDTGIAGTITWDANFIYVCVAPNTWKRSAIAAW